MNLINGDCLEELKKLESNSIDLVICDLPYGITEFKWDKKIDIDLLWKELIRVGKPNTPFFFFCTLKFGIEIINANPTMFKNDFVWNKTRMINPLLCKNGFNRSHESILVFYDKPPPYFHMKYHTKQSTGRNATISKVSFTDRVGLDLSLSYRYTPPLPLSILDFNPKTGNKKLHRTQKPTHILEMLIKYYSDDNAVILDPTMGSGSTGEACKNIGRRFIGIEKDPQIFEVAVKRLEEKPDDKINGLREHPPIQPDILPEKQRED
jgi:site-specific DNA-methyltransferase (adenine-specific)